MDSLPENPTLKEINAFKKKINWGEVTSLYQMVANSASDLDELLQHGFDSGYKSILNKKNWNLQYLQGSIDEQGNINVKFKPQVVLKHIYNEMGYEMHCYPFIDGDIALLPMEKSANCPFKSWHPENMRRLFRVNNLPNFIIHTFNKGDDADPALIKHIYLRVEELTELLENHFDVINIKGYTIAEFYKEVTKKHGSSKAL